jgi:hypothetical protein
MARYGIFAVSAILAIGLGLLVPLAVVFYMAHGLEVIAGVFVILISVIGGVSAGVVGMGLHFAGPFADNDAVDDSEEKLRVLRTSHRALLEEMDEELSILKEIRDSLKGTGGGPQ